MTVKIDQIADAVISAPGARAVVTQAPSGTINSGTWTELFSQNIIPTFAGLYRVDLSFTTYTSSGSSNGRFDFKLVFDEGGADEVTVSGDAWYWRQDDFFRYKQHNYHEFVELVAKSQTVKAYGRRDSGDFVLNVAGNQYTQVTIQSLVGSGAGGTLTSRKFTTGDFTVSGTVTPSAEQEVTDLTTTIDTTEGEEVLINLVANGKRTVAGSGVSGMHTRLYIDDVLKEEVVPGGTWNQYDSQNLSFSHLSVGLGAGSHTIKIKVAKYDSSQSDWVLSGAGLFVIQYRGGLVPIQQDGVDVIGQPRALNFIGAGVYEVTEGYGENAGVANIELNSAITALGDVVEVSGKPTSQVDVNSTTWKEILPVESFTTSNDGLYSIVYNVRGYAYNYVNNSTVSFKLVFDEGETTEQEVGGSDIWDWRFYTGDEGSIKTWSFTGSVSLSEGSHTVQAYCQISSGSSTVRWDTSIANAGNQILLQAVTGSGAGGTIDTEMSNSSSPVTIAAASAYYTLQEETITCVEGENVLVTFSGNYYQGTASGVESYVVFRVKVDGVLVQNAHIHKLGTTTDRSSADRVNVSFSMGVENLSAGDRTITIEAASGSSHADTNGRVEFNTGHIIQYRGGLVPIRNNGENIVDKPAAFDFISPGFSVTNSGGTARISMEASDGYLKLSSADSDPSSHTNDGYLYSKSDSGDIELFYLDDSGNAVQITRDGELGSDAYQQGQLTAINSAFIANDAYQQGELTSINSDLISHIDSTSNPHTVTLDQAYDGSGGGAGASILADSGPVFVDASGEDAVELDGYLILNEISTPDPLVDAGLLYSKSADGYSELFYQDLNKEVRLTKQGVINTDGYSGTIDVGEVSLVIVNGLITNVI